MKSNHNHQKKIAVINDLSGFGRCSLAVSMPVISAMGIQSCPLPTSIFSNHTGFKSFFFDDYTDNMSPYMDEWQKLDLRFSGILTGFLGSVRQIDLVIKFLENFKTEETLVIIDPVMGDYGSMYATYTNELCQEMKKLMKYADIITPNLTEACILTDTVYHEKWKKKELIEIAEKLHAMGPDKIVITGIPQGGFIANHIYESGKEPVILRTLKAGTQRSGTGDIFASIIAGDAVNDVPFQQSVKRASNFIKKCILRSIELEIPLTDGVCFEEFLKKL